jgi:hypothetical protein
MESGAPGDAEVRAVARLFGRRADELTAIKLPGPGSIGESVLTVSGPMPSLESFDPPQQIKNRMDDESRLACRYDCPEASVIVVSHETGPEIFVLIGAAGAATTVIRGVHSFIRWVRAHRPSHADSEVEPLQYWFVEDGHVRRRGVLPPETPRN